MSKLHTFKSIEQFREEAEPCWKPRKLAEWASDIEFPCTAVDIVRVTWPRFRKLMDRGGKTATYARGNLLWLLELVYNGVYTLERGTQYVATIDHMYWADAISRHLVEAHRNLQHPDIIEQLLTLGRFLDKPSKRRGKPTLLIGHDHNCTCARCVPDGDRLW